MSPSWASSSTRAPPSSTRRSEAGFAVASGVARDRQEATSATPNPTLKHKAAGGARGQAYDGPLPRMLGKPQPPAGPSHIPRGRSVRFESSQADPQDQPRTQMADRRAPGTHPPCPPSARSSSCSSIEQTEAETIALRSSGVSLGLGGRRPPLRAIERRFLAQIAAYRRLAHRRNVCVSTWNRIMVRIRSTG
jgi:hypothetical protein